MVITKLRLPRAYLLDFARKQYVPARLTITEKKNEQNFDIVCQSPNFRKSFTTMALSYDPQVRTTTGFLGLTTGQMREILEILDQLDCYAAHPILLPILMYAVCSNMLRRQLRDVNREVDFVQHQTGLLDGYLRKGSATLSGKSPDRKWEKPDYDDLHRILVEQHASLTTDLSYFVSDLGLACTEAMHTIKASGTDVSITSDTYIEMHSYLLQLKNSAEFQLQHRERMLSRIDMQLKVLYNLMQQNIANQTLRDSSTMKGIALLTMVFLPSTALAAIFSMSPFFSGDPNNSRLIVSGNIWVFWATAIPVTIAVIVIFAVWTEWAEFRRFLSSGRIEQASAV
ncbi:hypothetical protein B0O99DRAFT_625607 [Bisporella sp. PMI_857]|nr:hypothetical protein B0O99DRAFT_625607 [Bisporella sp. PMI_857]